MYYNLLGRPHRHVDTHACRILRGCQCVHVYTAVVYKLGHGSQDSSTHLAHDLAAIVIRCTCRARSVARSALAPDLSHLIKYHVLWPPSVACTL